MAERIVTDIDDIAAQSARVVVTDRHAVIRVGDYTCLATRRKWMDVAEVAALAVSLTRAVGDGDG